MSNHTPADQQPSPAMLAAMLNTRIVLYRGSLIRPDQGWDTIEIAEPVAPHVTTRAEALAQWESLRDDALATLRKPYADAPPETPSPKQIAYMMRIAKDLKWNDARIAAEAAARGIDYAGLTKASASDLIDALKAILEGRIDALSSQPAPDAAAPAPPIHVNADHNGGELARDRAQIAPEAAATDAASSTSASDRAEGPQEEGEDLPY